MQVGQNHIRQKFITSVYDPDAPDFQNQSNATNYRYDHIGNLVTDKSDSIKQITWTVSGKIKTITRDSLCTKPDLRFEYDVMGNRIAKHVMPKTKQGVIQPAMVINTVYVRDATGNIMSTYTNSGTDSLNLEEQPIYGSSRIGEYKSLGDSTGIVRGSRVYEESNHLENVLVTFTDRKIPKYSLLDTNYRVAVLSASDYYPFGMGMPSRMFNPRESKYGFNGMLRDNEIYGEGNAYDFGARMYDSRIGVFISLDPLRQSYPSQSPYMGFNGNPIIYKDPTGKGGELVIDEKSNTATLTFNLHLYAGDGVSNEQIKGGLDRLYKSNKDGSYTLDIPVATSSKDGGTVKQSFNNPSHQYTLIVKVKIDIVNSKDVQKEMSSTDASHNFYEVRNLGVQNGVTSKTDYPSNVGVLGLGAINSDINIGLTKEASQNAIMDEMWHTTGASYDNKGFGSHSDTDEGVCQSVPNYKSFNSVTIEDMDAFKQGSLLLDPLHNGQEKPYDLKKESNGNYRTVVGKDASKPVDEHFEVK